MVEAVHWCFTLNNYTDDHLTLLDLFFGRNADCNFLCYGKEVGASGTPHLQGYIQFTTRKRIRTIHRALGFSDLHLEAAMGSDEDNVKYCSKDGVWVEFGRQRPIKAKRKRGNANQEFESVLEDLKAGATMRDIAETYPGLFIKHYNGLMALYKLFWKKPFIPKFGPFKWDVVHDWQTSLLLWGEAGIGKTCYAQVLLPNALFVSHMDQLKSYNPIDYDGIIFDDMSFAHLPREAQIHIVDCEQDRAIHVRYGVAIIPAGTKKIFLANTASIFLYDPAINRRVTKINLT